MVGTLLIYLFCICLGLMSLSVISILIRWVVRSYRQDKIYKDYQIMNDYMEWQLDNLAPHSVWKDEMFWNLDTDIQRARDWSKGKLEKRHYIR